MVFLYLSILDCRAQGQSTNRREFSCQFTLSLGGGIPCILCISSIGMMVVSGAKKYQSSPNLYSSNTTVCPALYIRFTPTFTQKSDPPQI